MPESLPQSPEELAKRMPARSQEAERGVLGALLRDNFIYADVGEIVSDRDFYEDAHKILYRAMAHLLDQGQPVDLVTLGEELIKREQAEQAGGMKYLYELWEGTPTANNALYYAGIVRDRSIIRQLLHASTEILRDTYDPTASAVELLDAAEAKLAAISLGQAVESNTRSMAELVQQFAEWLDKAGGELDDADGIPFGFADLDHMTGGMKPGQLIVVGARPAAGKTNLGLAFASNAALKAGARAQFISQEMSGLELTKRAVAATARVDGIRINTRRLNPEDVDKINSAMAALRPASLWIDDTPRQLSMNQIRRLCRKHKIKHGLDLVVIDYLQRLDMGASRNSTREREVAQAVISAKSLARELNIPVVMLAQLNRESESRPGQRPRLSDLRDSGQIEQEGDVVLLLHPEPETNECPFPLLTVIVAKQRNGPTGDVKLVWRANELRYENYAPTPFVA